MSWTLCRVFENFGRLLGIYDGFSETPQLFQFLMDFKEVLVISTIIPFLGHPVYSTDTTMILSLSNLNLLHQPQTQ